MNFIYSSLGAFVGGLLYFLLGFFLDTKLNPKYSNIIANTLSIFISISIQSFVFNKLHYVKNPRWLAIAFMFELLSVILNEILFTIIKNRIDRIDKYKNIKTNYKLTAIRMITAIILYFIYTYPMRRYLFI